VEIPDLLFRRAKACAAEQGVPLKDLFAEAIRQHLQRNAGDSSSRPADPPWVDAFGGLRSLHKETTRINRILQQEFGRVEK
jgi:hypothetical protein